MKNNSVLILEADDRLRVVLSLFVENLGFDVITCCDSSEIQHVISMDQKADFILHRGESEAVAASCYDLTGKRPKILPSIDFTGPGLPDLHQIRSSFLTAV